MIPDRLRQCSLLIVDDEEANLDLLEGLLLSEGYTQITRVSDGRRVAAALDECRPALVLLDLHMPYRNGFEVLSDVRARVAADEYLPVLVLTADVTTDARDRALTEGARDFLTKPFDAVEVLLRVRNLLEAKVLHDLQRQARCSAEAAEERARLLSEASRLLGASLDSETALAQLATLLVRQVAGACAFLLLDEGELRLITQRRDGRLPDAPSLDVDSNLLELAAEVLERGESRVVSRAGNPVLVAPVATASRRVGVLAIAPRDRSPFDLATREMFADLAGRVALSLDNAQLFAAAQLASEARERMLSVVAHDLRNPLAVVGMYAEMLLGLLPPESDPYAADALSSIYRSTHRMQQQIEDLLDISRLQRGTFSLRPAVCLAPELFREAELLLRPLAESVAVDLVVEPLADCGEDLRVTIDGARFQQVVSNLVGNAIKFTPEGGRVIVTWTAAEAELRVQVRDAGPGIPEDQIPHIFEAFWQAPETDRRGLGLGLWIARSIVEAHGGSIWVDPSEGGGATFHFVLPSVTPEGRPAASRQDSMGRVTHVSTPAPN